MSQRPILPYVLGIAGLIPFVVFSSALVFEQFFWPQLNYFALIWYSAIILSFLGGTRWGAEIATNPTAPSKVVLVLAMLPSIFGWGIILSLDFAWPNLRERQPEIVLIVLALAFAVHLVWDIFAIRKGNFPKWYSPLRQVLTAVAIFSLLAPLFRYWLGMTA